MSEYKHTPGEWKRDRRASMHIVSSNGRGVASCGQVRDSTVPDNGDAENMANSQLILAAPRMLREMERYLPILTAIEEMPGAWEALTRGTGIATLNGYRHAIALATGAIDE